MEVMRGGVIQRSSPGIAWIFVLFLWGSQGWYKRA